MSHDRRTTTVLISALAAFVLLVAATQLITWWVVRSLERDFEGSAKQHIARDVRHLRARVTTIERSLDNSAERLRARLASQKNLERPALFAMLRDEVNVSRSGRGARILTTNGEPVAWWGDDLPFGGNRRYEFDVTNLYIVSAREAPPYRIQ
ncbi:MAG: hypothetical protein ACXW3E_12630, partial [Thermoanaerobaculia bacterium]